MRRPFPRTATLAVAWLAAACTGPEAGKTAFVGAEIFDGTGSAPIKDGVIIVAGSHIERVGPRDSVNVPRGAVVVRVDGKWVIPGLIDGHTHVQRWTLPRFLAYGVTSVRDVGNATDSIVALRARVADGTLAGPRLFISGAMIDGSPATRPSAFAAETPEDGRRAVDRLVLSNVSQIKVYTNVDQKLLEAVVDEAKTFHVPVTAHLGKVDAVTAARIGVTGLEHMSGVVEATMKDPKPLFQAHTAFFAGWKAFERGWASLDSAALDRTAHALIDAKVTIIPTLVQHQTYAYLEDPAYVAGLDLSGVPRAVRTDWDIPDLVIRADLTPEDYAAFRQSRPVEDFFVRLYHRAGGLVVAGTDTPNQLLAPGASLHDEMGLLVRAGLTPKDALLAATRDAARLLGADSLGVLKDGAPADFVVVAGNPLSDIANTKRVEQVVANGVGRAVADLRRGW